ncbi:uncharacterized protein [Rutidosis leptorrhynchoides]|uniref:uncharacterized protein n=1 Tax=Rutidosis leptorrhynchoides TaxID=125765 RepID=UPI003A99662E
MEMVEDQNSGSHRMPMPSPNSVVSLVLLVILLELWLVLSSLGFVTAFEAFPDSLEVEFVLWLSWENFSFCPLLAQCFMYKNFDRVLFLGFSDGGLVWYIVGGLVTGVGRATFLKSMVLDEYIGFFMARVTSCCLFFEFSFVLLIGKSWIGYLLWLSSLDVSSMETVGKWLGELIGMGFGGFGGPGGFVITRNGGVICLYCRRIHVKYNGFYL